MLPSDHFVRFYNELFKMLDEKSRKDLQEYWLEVSGLQEEVLGPQIRENGFGGMYEYWNRIKEEENCDLNMEITDDYFELRMNKCPSLAKVMDNDAGQFEYYCDHCAGWVEPIMKKYGYYPVFDIVSRTEPRCVMRVYRSKKKAADFEKNAVLPARPYEKS